MATPQQSSTDPTWRVRDFRIKKTTDFLALSAFLLSIAGILAQIYDHLRGPKMILFAPDIITIGSEHAMKRDHPGYGNFVRFIVQAGYVNNSPPGYNAAISRAYLRFEVGQEKIQHEWKEVVSSDAQGDLLVVEKKEDAKPFSVTAGGARSAELLFEPFRVKCSKDDPGCSGANAWLTWDDFLKILGNLPKPNIKVTLLSDIYGGGTVSSICEMSLNAYELDYLKKNEWVASYCNEPQ